MDGETGVLMDRFSRSTRGKRMLKLIDEEAEADEQFWGQDAFRDEGEDTEYEAEEEDADVFDSDFDEEENNVEDETPIENDERVRVKKKRLFPPGRKLLKENKRTSAPKTKDLSFIEAAVAAAMESNDSKPIADSVLAKQSDETMDLLENSLDLEGERSVRKSTRTAVVVRQAERDALRAAMQATIKPVKKKREGDEKRISQEDMLLEAAQTEIMNRQSLEKMLAREEEVKQKAIVHKTVYDGPQIRFYSRDGKNFLEFMKDTSVAEELFSQPKPDLRTPLECVVTGQPAKYVDPLTGLPYATKEAFKKIRERVDREDKFIQKKISETPWKRARSGRSLSVHANVTRARSYKLNAASFGSPSRLSTRTEAIPVGFDEKEIVRSHLLERSSSQDDNSEASAKGMERAFQTLNTCTIPEERSRDTVVRSGPLQVECLGDHPSAVGMDASPSSLFDNLKMPLWVDIPPPKDEHIDDEYILDDLTSLNFGPILSLQHGVRGQDLRELEADIETSPAETLLPFDVLLMPDLGENEFF